MTMEIVVSLVLLFVGIAVLVTIHVCVVGRAYTNGGTRAIAVRRRSNRFQSLSEEEITRLPCFQYRVVEERERGDREKSSVECAVCLENFKAGELLRLLPNCRHSFHAQCIDTWLSMKAVCPICRASIDSPETGAEGSRSSEVSGDELV
ncbi:hypothetical protein NMG60_11019349 [Bertholletia excelsa]